MTVFFHMTFVEVETKKPLRICLLCRWLQPAFLWTSAQACPSFVGVISLSHLKIWDVYLVVHLACHQEFQLDFCWIFWTIIWGFYNAKISKGTPWFATCAWCIWKTAENRDYLHLSWQRKSSAELSMIWWPQFQFNANLKVISLNENIFLILRVVNLLTFLSFASIKTGQSNSQTATEKLGCHFRLANAGQSVTQRFVVFALGSFQCGRGIQGKACPNSVYFCSIETVTDIRFWQLCDCFIPVYVSHQQAPFDKDLSLCLRLFLVKSRKCRQDSCHLFSEQTSNSCE